MFMKFIISAFKMEEDNKEKKNRYPQSGHASLNNGTLIVGLKILVQISQGKSNIVVKPALGSTRSASRRSSARDQYSCYLKSCHLCSKKLSLDREVYMHKGDIGFCSEECRDRQIYLDEMKELEASTKQILKSNYNYWRCNNSGADRRETRIILEEIRRERHHNKPQYSQKIHWAIIS